MRYRTDVDGLRAVAVLPVVLFHFGATLFTGGFTGVDIFFVISGFVIAGSITADIRADRFSIANFYFKRIRRIFPALAAVLLATTFMALVVMLPQDLEDYGRSLMATGGFVSNIFFWKSSGYFAAAAQTKPLLHTWSLSVEEQYYIFAPIAFALIYRYGRERWLLWFSPVILLSLAAAIAGVFVAPTASFFLLPTRTWELLLGAVIALRNRPAPSRPAAREVMAGIGMALIVTGMVVLDEGAPFPGWNALFPCVGTALLIQVGIGAPTLPLVNRLLATRPFVWVGMISYSLYLVHWPIAALTRYVTLRAPTTAEMFVMLAASLALAWASWKAIEQPFRHVGLARRGRVLAAGAAFVAATVALGYVGVAGRGLPGRFPDFVQRHIAGVEDWGGKRCFNTDPMRPLDWDTDACTRIRGQRGRILLWGDSFAAQYAPGILRDAARIDADVLQYTFAGCPPILAYSSLARPGCAITNARALDVVRAQRIDTVVLAARWADTPLRTIDRLGETVAALRRMGVRVVVIGQSPQFGADVQQVDYLSGNYRLPGTASWQVAFRPELNRRVAGQAAGATFVDPLAHLCRGETCPYRVGGTYLYGDYGHFSRDGSLLAVRRYFPAGAGRP